MKINKIIYLFMVSFLFVFSACEPIVEEEHLENIRNVDEIQLKGTQSTPGGNEVTLELLTTGVSGHWDYLINKGLSDRTTFVFPVTGTFNFPYKGTLGAEFFEKTVPVTIDVLDHPVPPEWGYLLGTDAVAGKTWVFDGEGGDGGLWWFMSAPNNPDGAMGPWWNAGGSCCPPSDVNGKMHFELSNAANYYHYETKDAEPTKGSFVLDVAGKRLIVSGAPMLGYAAGNKDGVYTIISLTKDKMVLYLNISETQKDPTGWTFVFRPE